MSETTHKVFVIYILINLALVFSLALPAAGMVNHLLPYGSPTPIRGLGLWFFFSLLSFLFTLPVLILIRRRLSGQLKAE